MTEPIERMGHCLCGAVHLTTGAALAEFYACHCGMCRRWGGGPLLAVDCGTEVTIEGEEALAVYDSSAWAERGFCARCGTHLFYRLKEACRYVVPLGLFDNIEGIAFTGQYYIDEKPTAYGFENATREMTAAEVYAAYVGES